MAIRPTQIIVPEGSPTIPNDPPIGFYLELPESYVSDEVIARLFKEIIEDQEITLSR